MLLELWLVVLYLVFYGNAQQCGTGCGLELTVCSSIDYPLYYTNETQVHANESLASQIMVEVGTLSQNCKDVLFPFLCNALHPSCDPLATVPTPILPCVDICTSLNTHCGSYKKYIPAPLSAYFNCNNTASKGQPLYADVNQTCSRVKNMNSICTSTGPIPGYTGICQQYNPQQTPLTGTYCAPFITSEIFVPYNYSTMQSSIDTMLGPLIQTYVDAFPIVPIDCYHCLLGLTCAAAFPPCNFVAAKVAGNTFDVPTGSQSCGTLCTNCSLVCSDFFERANLTQYAANCSTYPQSSTYQFTLTNTDVEVQAICYPFLNPTTAMGEFFLPNVSQCPPGTGFKSNPTVNESVCDLVCPDGSYTEKEWHDLVIITQIGAAISLACMAFLLISYAVQKERRKFPAVLNIWEFLATSGFATTFLVGGTHPEKMSGAGTRQPTERKIIALFAHCKDFSSYTLDLH